MSRQTATDSNASRRDDSECVAVAPVVACPVLRISPFFGSSNQMCPDPGNSDCPPTGRTAGLPCRFSSGRARKLGLTDVAETLVIQLSGNRNRQGQDSSGCSGQSQSRSRDARSGRVHALKPCRARKFSSVPCPRMQAGRRPAQHMRIIQFAAGDNRGRAATVFTAFVHGAAPIACNDISPHAILSLRTPGSGTAEADPFASLGTLDC